MDRHDASDNRVIEELVSSAERGMEVELTRDGRVVARVVAAEPPPSEREALEALHANLPAVFEIDWQAALQETREDRSFEYLPGHKRPDRPGGEGARL